MRGRWPQRTGEAFHGTMPGGGGIRAVKEGQDLPRKVLQGNQSDSRICPIAARRFHSGPERRGVLEGPADVKKIDGLPRLIEGSSLAAKRLF